MTAPETGLPETGLPEGTSRPRLLVRRYGDPVLSTPAQPVEALDDELADLVDKMWETLAAADGVGLAAPQVGVGLRLFVIDCPGPDDTHAKGVVVNPVLEVDERSRDLDSGEEGCLSVPGAWHEVARPGWARVTGVDEHGEPVSFEGTGLIARCLQHEYDHLDGIVYVDRLPRRARKRLLEEMGSPAWSDLARDERRDGSRDEQERV
ncbi:peptide deformylase [Motilibacter rhizosphaerae]|uniref:Peptide deformylase n=1 Tax=Motilibacter rhizosphaerae TaxID=598652 RepID=A0A4Q7NVR6_9ACTN|nr:peptide deformylase [Motilibacter rhizosphaerae]RZS91366.1 peptide deformylase [Motilibacter rhizosphaerae]